MTAKQSQTPVADESALQKSIAEILHAIQNLRYGSVEITVHEGRITQIERREKVRLSHK